MSSENPQQDRTPAGRPKVISLFPEGRPKIKSPEEKRRAIEKMHRIAKKIPDLGEKCQNLMMNKGLVNRAWRVYCSTIEQMIEGTNPSVIFTIRESDDGRLRTEIRNFFEMLDENDDGSAGVAGHIKIEGGSFRKREQIRVTTIVIRDEVDAILGRIEKEMVLRGLLGQSFLYRVRKNDYGKNITRETMRGIDDDETPTILKVVYAMDGKRREFPKIAELVDYIQEKLGIDIVENER